ncbi:hypothetical protein IAD21_04933 [Abditibacteriota bacterium]|nr:hypothetical protein IAD21_04933 [Abditibacteriota bacterium]
MKIHEAAAKGDIEAVLRELESGVAVDALNDEGDTPLRAVARSEKSNVETLKLLLGRGADPNSVLRGAVYRGNLAYVQYLLDAGADINFVDESGFDALMRVPTERFMFRDETLLPLVEFLLERGASVSNVNEDGYTALMIAFDNGSFAIVKWLLEAGADESLLAWTPLMRAIAIGTIDDVREQLEQGASLTAREECGERTPWLLSLSGGDIEKAKLLLAAGANLNDIGWYQKTALMYPIEANDPEMLKWLLSIGCDVDAAGEYGKTALMQAAQQNSLVFVQLLLEAGADPDKVDSSEKKAISHTSSLEIIRLLLATEQSLDDLDPRVRALLLGTQFESRPITSREEFEAGNECRFGISNPEKMDIPFWHAMVRSGAPAQYARSLFMPRDEWFKPERTPVWCHHRFCISLTELPDGRFIEIGGEHEDFYDPDFYIYNDVIVYYPDKTLDIWGYPAEVFPPTDGHTATLVDDFIYIIGCIGYPEQRVVGYTPVYRLNTQTFVIEKVETSGENPGWIFNHKAVLIGDEIHISGGETWTGPESPEKIAENMARMQKMAAFPAQEDYSTISEWLEATGRHLDENTIRPHESPDRFALNLKALQWRRVLN